jgi:NADH dehydrogenase (ubiquinone) Fe-S protein 2
LICKLKITHYVILLVNVYLLYFIFFSLKLSSSLGHSTLKVLNSYTSLRTFKLNFGPQHPAAHGVLRLILELNGEVVLNSDPHIGFYTEVLKNLLKIKCTIRVYPILID